MGLVSHSYQHFILIITKKKKLCSSLRLSSLCFQTLKHDEQDLIDKQVIHGHVVPEVALFTRTVQNKSEKFESLAFTENLKVFISMENVTADSEGEDVTCEYCNVVL